MTDKSEQLLEQSPDGDIAQHTLLRVRRQDRCRYNKGEIESLINEVTYYFLRAVPLDHRPPVQLVGRRESKKQSQCENPQAETQLQDYRFLFMDQIATPTSES
jgi:hypothetical protein